MSTKPFFCLMLCFSVCGGLAQSDPAMFLGNALHLPDKNPVKNDCFRHLAWKFNADAAIRSTPVSDDQHIYFGTEGGVFYSLNRSNAVLNWKFNAGSPIHSSPALSNGLVIFSDARQTLYALSATTGRVAWQTPLGKNMPYEWKFDFIWSSPALSGKLIYIGSGDGNLYAVNAQTGKIAWRFDAGSHIRSTPAIANGKVFFGDMNGRFYALDAGTGGLVWTYETNGVKFINDSFGYDRKGIVSSPVVIGDKLVFGSRDGYLYNLDLHKGTANWIFDYHITWIISSVACDGKTVFAGTSDGRYINAIDLQSGKELWRSATNIVWSSPLLINDKLYAGGYDGLLYCIDKFSGKRINSAISTRGRIQSSPVLSGDQLFIGSDDGYLYALVNAESCKPDPVNFNKYVYYDREVPRLYYRNGTDLLLRANLASHGFTPIDSKGLENAMKRDIPADSLMVIVMASNYFPPSIVEGNTESLLRQYLNKGGRLLVTGLNPVVYQVNAGKNEVSTDFTRMKTILDIDLKYTDSRAHGGVVYCSATKAGIEAGLPSWWMAPFPVDKNQIDRVLGENVNGDVSAYVKKYSPKKGSGLVQVWIDAELMPSDIDFIKTVALAGL